MNILPFYKGYCKRGKTVPRKMILCKKNHETKYYVRKHSILCTKITDFYRILKSCNPLVNDEKKLDPLLDDYTFWKTSPRAIDSLVGLDLPPGVMT